MKGALLQNVALPNASGLMSHHSKTDYSHNPVLPLSKWMKLNRNRAHTVYI